MIKNLFLPFIFLIFVGCSLGSTDHVQEFKEWMQPNGKLKVLSTIAMIHDLVQQIGGEHIDQITLIKGELDPHSYQLVKGDDEKLAFSDIIFFNGLGLEHGPSLQNYLLHNPKAIPLGNKVMDEDRSQIIYYKEQVDPHIWMDVSIWTKTISYIVEALASKDPAHAEVYRTNGSKLYDELMEVHYSIKNLLGEIPDSKRFLVTSHDAFNYFTRAYLAADGEPEISWRERFVAPEGLAPESQISATDIQNIICHLKKYHIFMIFPESNVNRDSIRKIINAAKEKKLDVKMANTSLYADAMGGPGSSGDNYQKMMLHNAQAIAAGLRENEG